MSERLKAKIGEELYSKILETGIKENEFDLIDGFIPRSRFNEVNEKLKATEGKITSYESQLNETKTLLKDSDDLKAKYSELENKYSNDLKLKDKEITNTTKKFMIENTLVKEGAKHTSLLIKEIDLDKLSIEGENILGLKEVVESLKTNYSDLFTKTETKNNTSQNKNSNTSGNSDENWDELLKTF
jgi:hypothetical protein